VNKVYFFKCSKFWNISKPIEVFIRLMVVFAV